MYQTDSPTPSSHGRGARAILTGMRRSLFLAAGFGVVALVYACVGDDPSTSSAPAPEDAAAETSAPDAGGDAPVSATDAAACDLSLEFSDLEPLTSLNGPADDNGPVLTHDELQLVFASNRNAPPASTGDDTDLWAATRASINDPFEPATTTLVSSLNVAGKLDSDPALSDDGLLLVWTQRQLEGGVDHILHYSERAHTTDAFGASAPISFPDGGGPGGIFPKSSALTGDGALYFVMRVTGDPDYRVFRAARGAAVGQFDVPVEQTLRSSGAPIHANGVVLTPDEKTMYIGLINGTDSDIAVMKRADATAQWEPPQTLAKLSSGAIDQPRWLSPDGCRLYLSSARAGGAGLGDLYVARRK